MKLSNEAQEEQFREIGVYLRQAREEKAISIEEVATHTRIRAAFIEAIEQGRAEDLPEAVFVQGFMRRYCDAIGIDGTILTANFGDLFLPMAYGSENKSIEKKSSLYIPLAVPYVLLLIGASLGLFYILSPKRNGESIVQNNKLTATSTPSPTNTQNSIPVVVSETSTPKASPTQSPTTTSTPEASPTLSPTANPTPTPISTPSVTPTPSISPTIKSGSGVEVEIELQGESWLRVKVDGKTAFEGTLKKGDKQAWTGAKEVSVYSGNAGAVLVSANKKTATVMGGEGSLKFIKYAPEPEVSATAIPSPQ
ncbi:helix-turn-helix domain-containing protein [Brunnivagina elsteri]|uniref:Helix-turn-helix domain-containing protein n=1 Tax=Brunnivagina elsteri CCALA 953 TaxID=987040 RepID=A0A2A2TBT0_9CYAN|nr:RodZ domain-containing protein [Calothrix elsteri]PAX51163.1 helix-turn-helix domain-containing protein [Calothrix elsteri CCALA 953]